MSGGMAPLVLLLWCGSAWAHRAGLSYAEIGDDTLTLTFSKDELAARVPFGVVAEARDLLAAATLDKVMIRQGGALCALGAPSLSEVAGGEAAAGAAPGALDGVALRAPLTCPGPGPRAYEAGFLASMEAGHRHFVTANRAPVGVLDAAHTGVALPAPSAAPPLSPRRVATLALPAVAGVGFLCFGIWAVARGLRRDPRSAMGPSPAAQSASGSSSADRSVSKDR